MWVVEVKDGGGLSEETLSQKRNCPLRKTNFTLSHGADKDVERQLEDLIRG